MGTTTEKEAKEPSNKAATTTERELPTHTTLTATIINEEITGTTETTETPETPEIAEITGIATTTTRGEMKGRDERATGGWRGEAGRTHKLRPLSQLPLPLYG